MNFQNPDFSIVANKKLYIFDMDGTIYLGNQVFPYAIRFIKNLRKQDSSFELLYSGYSQKYHL